MGSTIYERLGPKPAKYSMGQALGDAIKGGGAYFGAVAVEKAKAEALQQARAAKLEDRDYARSEKLADRDYAREVALTDQAREDSYRETPAQRRAGELQAKLYEVELGLAETPDNARLLNRQSEITKELELLQPKADSSVDEARRKAEITIGNQPRVDAQTLDTEGRSQQQEIDINRENGLVETLDEESARGVSDYRAKEAERVSASLALLRGTNQTNLDMDMAETVTRKYEAQLKVAGSAQAQVDKKISERIPVLGTDLASKFGVDAASIDLNGHYIALANDKGELKMYVQDSNWVQSVDGTWGNAKAGASSKGNKLTESQSKFRLHATGMTNARKEMERILDIKLDDSQGRDGYKLRSGSAFWDRLVDNVPLIGNFIKSDKGQQFLATTARLGEHIFKGESGAAGSDAEASRYYSFLPQAGDTPETIKLKMRILDASETAFRAAGEMGLEADDAVMYARQAAQEQAESLGFTHNSGYTGWEVPKPKAASSRFTIISQD